MSFDLVTSIVDRPCAMPMGGGLPPEVRALDAGLRAIDRAMFGGQPTPSEIEEADAYATGQPEHVKLTRMIVATTRAGHGKYAAQAEAERICSETGQPVMFIFNGQVEFINPDE